MSKELINGLTEEEVSNTASVFGLIGDRNQEEAAASLKKMFEEDSEMMDVLKRMKDR